MHTIPLTLSTALANRLQAQAQAEGIAPQALCKKIIDAYIEEKERAEQERRADDAYHEQRTARRTAQYAHEVEEVRKHPPVGGFTDTLTPGLVWLIRKYAVPPRPFPSKNWAEFRDTPQDPVARME